MKKVVLFLLVNGIGFGHFKRALVIANAFDKAEYDICFIVQASSTNIFKRSGYKVFAFPLLYSIKNNNSRDIIYTLLNSLVYKLSPSVVFEDTYPEDDYLNLPALSNIPRMLIVRRVDSHHLENLFYDGYLSCYDAVYLMENKKRVIDNIGNYCVKNYLNYSDKIKFIGDIFDKANNERIMKVRKKYHLSEYKKNVVFNCGAGGWHKGENICKRIFDDGLKAITHIAETHPEYQFVFVAGPYSEWSLPEKNKAENIRFEEYEEDLSALLQSADLCIIRPGYNAVMECLSGESDVILLPSISYMEKQNDWCDQLIKDFGLNSVAIGDVDALHNCICKCLGNHMRNTVRVESNEIKLVDYVTDYLDRIKTYQTEGIISLSRSSFSHKGFAELCIEERNLYFDGEKYPVINLDSHMNYLDYLGKIVVFYYDENHEYEGKESICKKQNLIAYGIVAIEVYELKYITYNDAILKIHNMIRRGRNCINIVFDNARDNKETEFIDYIDSIISTGDFKAVKIQDILRKSVEDSCYYKYTFRSIGIRGLE